MALKPVNLDDKYRINKGRIFISGNQALTRLPLMQRQLDKRSGLKTAGFISGYRGSPLGNYDTALSQAKQLLAEHDIIFQPGVNEDLAATAIWGTQQLDSLPEARVDGVFSIWYGKGPGVDRSGDAFKHGNTNGVHKNGGVLVIYGDDHPGKSSTIAHQSEHALAANSMPSLYPSDVQDFIEFGLLAWALSRYSGLWVGMKTVNETVEQTATIDVDIDAFHVKNPGDGIFPEKGVHYRANEFNPQQDDILVTRYKLPLVHKFVRANHIDKITLDVQRRCLGIVTAGKAYKDVCQALQLLGIDAGRADDLGLSVYKVGCIWPLEPEGVKFFALGQQELLVVEEKKAFMEDQAAKILYHEQVRPRIVGKFDEHGQRLLPADVQLDTSQLALIIAGRLLLLGMEDQGLQLKVMELQDSYSKTESYSSSFLARTAYFCSGCPHNRSTVVPEGSVSGTGIGCHTLAVNIRPNTLMFAQMGAEGATWFGLSQFSKTKHIFQNMGDGTYYHSGLMAIRGAVAAKVNITYKILYNDAVAMTGGQAVDGPLSVADITYQVLHEGVKRCLLVTENPKAYKKDSGLATGVEVFHRDDLEAVQRQLREIEGCTVLIYEQTCAAEKRRRRKRQQLPDPPKRLFINDAVCEGCGDCSVQSNCVSLQPKETELGRKREIDQSSCNKDFSCVKGFCPSFVTVAGGQLKKPQVADLDSKLFENLPAPKIASLPTGGYGVLVAGIGGTGVITVSAVLGMAAHLEGKTCSIFDMTGLSQKNGAVYSHLRIASNLHDITAARLGRGEADLILAFDMVAALSGDGLQALNGQRSSFVGNSHLTATGLFQTQPDLVLDAEALQQHVRSIVGDKRSCFIEATALGLALFGDTIAANMFMVGCAVQLGLIPVAVAGIEKAIEMNGVAVQLNLQALRMGRVWVYQPQRIIAKLPTTLPANRLQGKDSVKDVIKNRVELLSAYQNSRYASRYSVLVEKVAVADKHLFMSAQPLTLAVANNFAKLMSYKDEYEVARLYAGPDFTKKLRSQFEGNFSLKFNLAPPLFSKKDPITGHLLKGEYGPWILPLFRLLAKFKYLRGTPMDIFGYTQERKMERGLIESYEQMIAELLSSLSADNYFYAVKLAQIPEQIRGFGHIKDRSRIVAEEVKVDLLKQFHNPVSPVEFVEVKLLRTEMPKTVVGWNDKSIS